MATGRPWQDTDSEDTEDLLLPQVATHYSDRKHRIRNLKLLPVSLIRRTSRFTILLCGTLVLFVWGLFVSMNHRPSLPHMTSDALFDAHQQEIFEPPPPPPEPEVTEPPPPAIDVEAIEKEAAEQARIWKERAESVRDAFKTAYNAYETYASPHDELLPLTNRYQDK